MSVHEAMEADEVFTTGVGAVLGALLVLLELLEGSCQLCSSSTRLLVHMRMRGIGSNMRSRLITAVKVSGCGRGL